MINVRQSYYTSCDKCNLIATTDVESLDELSKEMESTGWKSEKAGNGSTWHYCPKCALSLLHKPKTLLTLDELVELYDANPPNMSTENMRKALTAFSATYLDNLARLADEQKQMRLTDEDWSRKFGTNE